MFVQPDFKVNSCTFFKTRVAPPAVFSRDITNRTSKAYIEFSKRWSIEPSKDCGGRMPIQEPSELERMEEGKCIGCLRRISRPVPPSSAPIGVLITNIDGEYLKGRARLGAKRWAKGRYVRG